MVAGGHIDECHELSLNLNGLSLRVSPEGAGRFVAPKFAPCGFRGMICLARKVFYEDGRHGRC